jgi:N-acetylmuramoyl-L-alanine amidase
VVPKLPATLLRLRRRPAAIALCLTLVALTAAGTSSGREAVSLERAPRPAIIQRPIPFSASRRRDMAAYSKRHYGIDSWQLARPHVIVEHYTASNSFSSAFSTFARNIPDGELHELPGTCAHFVIDTDGRIYQLVPLSTMCRHTVGLNWTAIGIEHVGTSTAQVLGNPRQRSASLRLSLWLADAYRIALADVIGHNESLESPYRRERYAAWRCQTHGDFTRAEMIPYRQQVARMATRTGVTLRTRSLPGRRSPCR